MAGRNNNNNNYNKNKREENSISKKIFSKLTGYDKDGKGVKKRKISDKERYSLKGFFAVYKNQFWNLIILNLIYMLLLSPAVCGLLSYTGVFGTRVSTPSNIFYAPIYGVHLCYPTPSTTNLLGIFGAQDSIVVGNTLMFVMNCITLIVFLTFGLANAGMTYVLRAYTRNEYAYLWHDFFKTIKKNFFGAMALGFADLLVIILLVLSLIYYYTAPGGFEYTILFFIVFSMSVIYFMMRFYLYILLITFKLSPIKLIKNAFILALLGIKRNFAAILGIAVMMLLYVLIFMFSIPFGITLPFFFLMSNGSFIACFAAYPNVKKYMIDPYYSEQAEKDDKLEIEEEPIFIDRG